MKADIKNTYVIEINGTAVSVSKEVYQVYEDEKNNKRNRLKRDKRNRLVFYHNLDTDELSGEEILCDNTVENTSEKAERALMLEKLQSVLSALELDEYDLIYHLYFRNMSERAYQKKTGIPQKTINDKRKRILGKLHKLLGNQK